MTTFTTPKIDAFRSIVQQAGTLHAELSTLDIAIRDLDAIKARMGDCRDEAEARKSLGELTRAEEAVAVKRIREPRLRAELANLLIQTEEAYGEAHSDWCQIIEATPKRASEAFLELLLAAQLDPKVPKVELANPVVVEATRRVRQLLRLMALMAVYPKPRLSVLGTVVNAWPYLLGSLKPA